MPAPSTVVLWVSQDATFAEQYARAKDNGIDAMAEEILDIADSAQNLDSDGIAAARLRMEARKWIASKLKAKKYGDRPSEVNVETHVHNHVSPERQKQIQARHRAAVERMRAARGITNGN